MKKFIFMMFAMFTMAMTMNAQNQSNYSGSSKFTDNWSVTLQGGIVTPFNDCFTNGSTTPIIVLGADKYINPWLGVGIDGRTSIGTGDNYNPHTAFDAVNLNGYVKLNVVNMFNYTGDRKMFEPVVYTGLGWGHTTCSDYTNVTPIYAPTHTTAARNYLTYRAGVELNFNLGKEKAWAVVVNPSVVWGNICNARLDKRNGNFELTAGVVYHFKNSNSKRSFSKAKLYNQAEIDALNAKIAELENRPAEVVEKVVERFVENPQTNDILGPGGTRKYIVMFEFNSAALSNAAKEELNKVHENIVVDIDAYASPEGNEQYNLGLSEQRKNVVKAYLESRGVKVNEARFHGAADKYSNRVAIVTMVGPNTDHGTGFNPHPHGEHPNGFNPNPHGTQK